MKIAMVSVLVEDPVKAFEYYNHALGFEEAMYATESYIAIVKSTLDPDGTTLLLEPTEPGGLEIAKEYKQKLYAMGIPVTSIGASNIHKTADELKGKGSYSKKIPRKPTGDMRRFLMMLTGITFNYYNLTKT